MWDQAVSDGARALSGGGQAGLRGRSGRAGRRQAAGGEVSGALGRAARDWAEVWAAREGRGGSGLGQLGLLGWV